MSTPSTNTLGKYQIIREIARSNDIVYEATDPTINRRVALKELSIPPGVQGAQRRERVERFWREGKAAGRLSHPNIVTIFDVGKEGDRHYIAMEYLEGQTLRDVIQTGGPMSIKDATSYMLQLCSALAYAHQNGVIHRDIKPENVQILPGGLVKLTDFGIARLMGESPITQDGQVFGTPSYMSPEQVAGKKLDARSDIFSMGVLLYEMVSGHKPFAGDSVVTITYNIMNMEPPPPPGAPPWISGIIRKAMSKEPDMRYSTADEMAQDLREEKCSGQFGFDPLAGSSYPSPYGGAQPSPYGGAQHPQTPFGDPQDPFGGPPAQPQSPYGQPPQQSPYGGPPPGPLTPYGTPMPSADPFAQGAAQSIPMAPPMPPRPMMSSETRNFLGIFFLTIGVAGMLLFATWALTQAFQSFTIARTGQIALRYYNQGMKLYQNSDLSGATMQWKQAVRVSPESKAGKAAREAIFRVTVIRAASSAGNPEAAPVLAEHAKELIEMKPQAPEGHYYAGVASELQGDKGKATTEYELAMKYGGNDQYAMYARQRRDMINGGGSGYSGNPSSGDPAPSSEAIGGGGGIPFQGAQ